MLPLRSELNPAHCARQMRQGPFSHGMPLPTFSTVILKQAPTQERDGRVQRSPVCSGVKPFPPTLQPGQETCHAPCAVNKHVPLLDSFHTLAARETSPGRNPGTPYISSAQRRCLRNTQCEITCASLATRESAHSCSSRRESTRTSTLRAHSKKQAHSNKACRPPFLSMPVPAHVGQLMAPTPLHVQTAGPPFGARS